MGFNSKRLLGHLWAGFTVLLLVLYAGHLQAQAQDTEELKWTPQEMINLPVAGETAISPDGEYVAYTVRETLMEGEQSEYLTHIWVTSTDGAMNRQYTRGEHSAGSPSFTPDGNYLSFTSDRESERPQVFRMPIDGGEAEQVTNAENGISSYQWSPDGERIAYTMTDPPSEEEQQRQKEKRDVILVDQDYKFSRLYVQDINADSSTQLTTGDRHVTAFDWAPAGSQLVFDYGPTPKTDDNFHTKDIALVPADSGEVQTLVDRDGVDANPVFTPDGETVVFTSHGGSPEPIGLSDVYRVSADGGEPQALAETPDRNANIVGITEDGEHVLVSESYKTVSSLYRLPADGSGSAERITPEDGVYRGFVAADNNDQLSFTYQNAETPAEVYQSSLDDFSKKQVSEVYSDIDFPEMGKTEVISWESDDGTEVEGLLTYPVDYEEGERYPLILNVHGGPAGVYSQTFTGAGSIYALQYFADNGYAILRPNPRGSTGYGKDFRYANVQDWGFGDYEDLMSGVDEVIDRGVADPDNLVEMGWSYGGYMTSFIVTRTDRFKAVSMGAGLSNLISMTGTTDIPTYLKAHMDGVWWDEGMKEVYERHSAIYHMDQVETPTQIIHGAEDERVPPSQGEEFYWALQEIGVPTEMIKYPRTPHGPQEPKFTADVSERILEWFDKHLERAGN